MEDAAAPLLLPVDDDDDGGDVPIDDDVGVAEAAIRV